MTAFDPQRQYMMPTHFGPRPTERATGMYHEVTSVIVPYVTDAKKLAAYVPGPFRVAEEPIVVVLYARNRRVDWLAGHGYNLIEVLTPVTFEGKRDRLTGQFHAGDLGEPDGRDPRRARVAGNAKTVRRNSGAYRRARRMEDVGGAFRSSNRGYHGARSAGLDAGDIAAHEKSLEGAIIG